MGGTWIAPLNLFSIEFLHFSELFSGTFRLPAVVIINATIRIVVVIEFRHEKSEVIVVPLASCRRSIKGTCC